MEIFTILYVLTLNYIATEAYERVGRAASCPKFTEADFPGLKMIKYRRKGTRAQFRCRKKFLMYGPRFATCQSDGTWSNEPPLCTKPGCVPLDPSQVTNLDMEVVNGAVVKFSCLNNYLLMGDTQAHCNGTDWSAPLPRCAAPHELTECDFEEDLCGWKQDDDEKQDWILNVGATKTGNTGPKHDHTLGDTGNGHYLYFETSHPTFTGHQANLLSPMYTEDLSPMCFDFWYHILGPDEKGHVGSLEVFVLDQSQYIDDDDVKPFFYIDGNQGYQWHRGNIFIEKQDEPFQISIVATRALSYISDIAIDDLRLHNCTKNTTSPPVTSSSSSSTTTTSATTSTSGTTTTTTVTTKITETSSPTSVVVETTTITKTPTETTIKKETTTTKSPETTVINTSTSDTNKPVTTTTESTTVVQTSSSPDTPQTATSSTKAESSFKVTMARQTSQSTPKPSFTETTMGKTRIMQPEMKTTPSRQATTQSTKKVKTPGPDITDTAGTPTIVSSSTTSSSTASTSSSTKSPITSTTVTSSTTSEKSSTPQPTQEPKTTTRRSSKESSTSPTYSKQTSTSYEKTTVFSAKTSAPGKSSSTSKSSSSTTTSSSFSSSSSSSSSSFLLKPLMIGLGVGIVSGLIIIGVIVYVCVRRRKFHTSRHEDELKPKTNSASLQSLNNGHFYQDEEYESES